MTRNLLAILSLLPLAFGAGCEDTDRQGDGNESDADTDTDFEASIVVTIPFEDVQVTVERASVACDVESLTCTYQVPETGRYDWYDVEAEGTYTFISKKVKVNDPGEYQVSWVTGGCASDPEWDATTVCDEWVPGEYGLVPLEGSYTDEYSGADWEGEIIVSEAGITITDLARSESATFSGDYFYTVNEDGKWQAGLVIDENTFQLMASKSDGSIEEWLFHRD